tara:strand:- start:14135 stop:15199 length:1065 start_codon:yes stop_codon:yes gene_type:complete
MHLLKHFKLKNYFTILLFILITSSNIAQIDNGTDYISKSLNNKLAEKSQCDLIYTRDGKIISVLIKDTLLEHVNYKICNNYGSNATVNGKLMSISNSVIDKIIFSSNYIKQYEGVTKSKLKHRQKLENKKDFNFEKEKFVFLSAGGNNNYSKQLYTDIGFLKQISKNFGIGSSFSFMRSSRYTSSFEDYVTKYDYVGLATGEYTSDGEYVGTAGYQYVWNGFQYEYIPDDNGPYNQNGIYVGTDGGYEDNSSYQIITDQLPGANFFTFSIDFKFSFFTNKRIQPFIISSLGGTITSVDFESYQVDYYDGFGADLRFSSGFDFFSKKNMVFSILTNLITESSIEPMICAKISYKI